MKTLLALAAASLSTMAAAAPVTIYSNDFDGNVTGSPTVTMGTGIGVEDHQALPSMSGNILRGQGTDGLASAYTLQFAGLGSHSSVGLSFLFAFIDSWDSTNGSPAPDYFYVIADGNTIGQYTSNNASGSVVNGPGSFISIGSYGFNGGFTDSVWDASTAPELNFAHSGSSLTLQLYAGGNGWQGGGDESWGMDNLVVTMDGGTTDPVPEPGMIGLLGLGVAALAASRRRKA